ncbi:MAG: hypothetical protein JST19_06055 [Bacteroidetes bacterium]|nr:hypothetical protein [Bacteroidota bacterium]
MPIRNQIEAITQSLSEQPNFLYGTANELNLLADDANFPIVFMYPLQPIDVSPQVNGSVDNTFSVAVLQRRVDEIKSSKFKD